MRLIDSHCHLDFDDLYDQLDIIISRAKEVGVEGFLVPAININNWQKVLDLSTSNINIYPALGFHPYFLADYQPKHMAILEEYLSRYPQIIAIGECGLDKVVDIPFALQMSVLEQQLQLAKKFSLPVILHCRKAHSELILLLKKAKLSHGGVIHAFSGSEELANEYIKLGFKIGVGGVITYPRASKIRQTITKLPLSCILLETDAPGMPIYQQKDNFNEPANIKDVLKTLALLKNKTKEEISSETCRGFYTLFFTKECAI